MSINENFGESQYYALGLLWADGYMNKRGNSFTLRIETTRDDFDYFLPILLSLSTFSASYRHREGRKPQGCASALKSQHLCGWLYDLGFKEKSLISPCKLMENIPEIFHKDFIRGWSDGDGCFYINEKNKCNQYSVAGSYNQDWSAFEGFLKKENVNYRIVQRFQGKNSSSVIRITGIDNLKKFISCIYDVNSKSFLPRKREKALKILNKEKLKTGPKPKNDGRKS